MNPEADNNLQEWEAQLADYALGVMESGAAAEFERQLNECRTHVMLAQQYSQVIAMLGYAAPSAEPPMDHKARFMSRLAATPRGADATSVASGIPVSVASPAVVPSEPIAGPTQPAPAPVTDLGEYRERKRARLSLPAIAAIAAALVLLVGGTAFLTSLINKPAQPQLVAFRVQGHGTQRSASAFGVLDTKTNEAYLLTNDLRPLSPDQVYELWWLPAKGNPVAAGTFNVDNTGKARHTAKAPETLAQFTGVAVTVEKAPGGSTPAGNIVLVGNYTVP